MIELIVGGARSGKSSYALSRAESGDASLTFIATAEAKDDEMMRRIERHRQERGPRWNLIEETHYISLPGKVTTVFRQLATGKQ